MRRFAGICMTAAVLALAVGCGKKDSTEAGGGGGTGGTGGGGSIEGTYVLVSMEMLGQTETPKESEADRTMKITADKMIMTKGGKEDPATYKLDNSKNPKEIDLTNSKGPKGKEKEEKMYGIYKVEGDKLILAITMSDKAADRPKDFKTGKDDKSLTMIMTLQKK